MNFLIKLKEDKAKKKYSLLESKKGFNFSIMRNRDRTTMNFYSEVIEKSIHYIMRL